MSKRSKQAIEALDAKVREAKASAGRAYLDMPLEEMRQIATNHPIGENYSGWKNPYPTSDPRQLLLEYQFADFHDTSRYKASLWSRQTGKDFTGEGEIVTDCLNTAGSDWMVAAPSERQAMDSLDQARLWAEAYDLAIADYIEEREGGHSRALLKSAEIIFSNRSRARCVPGKPDTVRGRSCNVYLTEFDFFENPAATWRAILPSITNPLRGGQKKVRLRTTPNGKGGAMDRIWHKDPTLKMRWSKHLVTIYHAVLMGLPVDWQELYEAFDDPTGWSQEFECLFLDAVSVLLPYELIALAEDPTLSTACESDFWDGFGNRVVIGIDFGRSGDPTVAWTLEEVGGTWFTREVLVLKDTPTNQQEEILRHRIKRADLVCLDYTGPGIGLGDYLVAEHGQYDPAKHEFGKVELCTFTSALKREMFPRLRRAFEAPTRVRIPMDIDVREDLHGMQARVTANGFSYDSPRTSKGHSDRCVALALAWRAQEHGGSGPVCFMDIPRRSQSSFQPHDNRAAWRGDRTVIL